MNSPKKFTRSLVLVFSFLLVSSCGPDGSTTNTETETAAIADSSDATANSASNNAINAKAQFTATLLSGATFDSATVLQSQPLALWFWAPG